MPDFGFTFERGGRGYSFDWEGEKVLIKAAGAAKVAVQAAMEIAVGLARANHHLYPPPSVDGERFARRTEQTIAATKILDNARIEWRSFGIYDAPHVWGRWGVEDGPAFQDPDEWRERMGYRHPREGELQDVTIVDRAMFLEFGTYKMTPRPFLYPAWDESKVLILPLLRTAYEGMRGGRA